MSTEPLECAHEASVVAVEPPIPNHGPTSEEDVDLPYRISIEHCYSRLVPFRSSPPPCSLSKRASFPTVVLFESCVTDKSRLKGLNIKSCGRESGDDHMSKGNILNGYKEDDPSDNESGEDEDVPVDVVTVDPVPDLPYDEKKVSSIMVECSRHISLVKVPAENSDLLLTKAIQEASYHRRGLLRRLVAILEADHLARLASAHVPHEPIKRRLNTDRAARQFRKALADVRWDTKLIRYCHETLLQVLNSDLLPIYLDILQVLKAKCPVLVENMIHSSVGLVGNEAFGLLLKRPWNPVVGLNPVEKQVKFDAAPLFITLPYSTTSLGGRRMRMLQTHLSVYGKVYPVMLPDKLNELAQGVSLEETAEVIITASIDRVHELQAQHPARPIILIGFSIGGRIAAKVAEIESVSCIISIGLPVQGLNTRWTVSSDPFKECKTPTVFIIGSETNVCSMEYVEELRSRMDCPSCLIIVGGGDELVRMSAEDKAAETVCQSIVDRCMLDKVYEFIVYVLPCSYPDEQNTRLARKRKGSNTDDIGSAFLTPAVALSPIRLNSPSDDLTADSKNVNFNNSNSSHRSSKGKLSPREFIASRSSTPSPTALFRRQTHTETPHAKRKSVPAPDLPKIGRPRSRSISDTAKKRSTIRMRSISSEQTGRVNSYTASALALNANNSNSNISPPGVLSIPQANMRPLPITPPRNPFAEDMQGSTGLKLDPKTLKQLQKGTR